MLHSLAHILILAFNGVVAEGGACAKPGATSNECRQGCVWDVWRAAIWGGGGNEKV